MAPEKSVSAAGGMFPIYEKAPGVKEFRVLFRLISQEKLTNSVFPVGITVTPQGARALP